MNDTYPKGCWSCLYVNCGVAAQDKARAMDSPCLECTSRTVDGEYVLYPYYERAILSWQDCSICKHKGNPMADCVFCKTTKTNYGVYAYFSKWEGNDRE